MDDQHHTRLWYILAICFGGNATILVLAFGFSLIAGVTFLW